jgi:hypothetical protein
MFTKLLLIFILQFEFFQTSFSVQVGGTSMDSTHYDRRIFQQQCPINNQLKEQSHVMYSSNAKSSLPSTNNSHKNNFIPIRRQYTINNGDDRLIIRASSGTINVNNTDPLDIDQAVVDVIVNKQVRSDV